MAVRLRRRSNGKKSFQAEVYVGRSRVAFRTFETQAAAHAWHDQTKHNFQLGLGLRTTEPTVVEVVEDYRTNAFSELRKSSQQARQSRFRYIETAPLAATKINALTPGVIDEWLFWLRAHGTATRSQRQSFEQELKLLSVILHWYKNERDHRFVVPIVRGHWKKAFFKPVPVRTPDFYLQPEDVAVWLEKLAQRPDPVYQQVATLMVLCGLRMGEACGLCWDAVEIDEKATAPRISIVRTLSWDYRSKEPYFQDDAKTAESVRTVPLAGPVLEMLRQLRTQSEALAPKGHKAGPDPVFLTNRGRLLRDNSVRANFNAAFRGCGLKWSGTHIARHTFATLALIAARDLGAVQAILGHRSQRVTEQYAKVVALRTPKLTEGVAALIKLGSQS